MSSHPSSDPTEPGDPARALQAREAEGAAQRRTSNTLLTDEINRTRAFLVVSGTLSVLGAGASLMLPGDPTLKGLF